MKCALEVASASVVITVLLATPCVAQTSSGEKPLVHIDVGLVQVDVVVTDAKGNHVSDLKPEEFEVVDNGKPRQITNFSFLAVRNNLSPAGQPVPTLAAVPAARIAPGQANRTIAVVVDDLGVGEQSFAAIHAALEKFVEEEIEPGDLVAIVTTSGRLGALQRLTGDKRMLRAIVNRFRSLPNHRPGVGDDDFTCAWFKHKSSLQLGGGSGIQDEDAWLAASWCKDCPRELDPQLELENDRRSAYYGVLSLSSLRRVVDGLRELPGRRSILLFSEGLPLVRGQGSGETNPMVTEAYETFLRHADRSGIAVNTIDPRVLPGSFETGKDECGDARTTELALSQLQLNDIARRTGGIAIVNNNDIPAAMARVANDQRGYYLIGYKPQDGSKRGFRKIAVRVTRPGLRVRYHSSLYEQGPEGTSPDDRGKQLVAAIASPFSMPNVRVRVASRFWDAGPTAGLVLDTSMEIDARDLSFQTEDGGRRKAVFDLLAVIYGASSKPLDTFEKSYTVSLTQSAYERTLRDGLVQRLRLQVKGTGAYQIRGAVRDLESGRIGSAGEFVELPDLTRGRLAISGIALSGVGTPDRSRFRAGEQVFYDFQVLNAEPGASQPLVEVRAALFREGQTLGTSAPLIIDAQPQADKKRLVVSNDLRLGKQLPPGAYTLQVTAVDRNAPQKRSTASQSVDFEIVE